MDIPESAKDKLVMLYNQLGQAQKAFGTYAEGVKDGLGLDGDYNLDTKNWTFVQVDKEVQDAVH